METVLDPARVILQEIAELEVERARTEAKIAERMLAFQDLRRVEPRAVSSQIFTAPIARHTNAVDVSTERT